jgi:glycosidase
MGQYELVRSLAKLRGEMPALRYGELRFIWSQGDTFAFTRTQQNQRVLVVVNRGNSVENLFVPIVYRALRVLWGTGHVSGEAGGVRIGLGASEGLVIGL